MAIRPESRWWIVTLVLVALLFGLSALALDRPNVVWRGSEAHCPLCASVVKPATRRCPECREEYDWTVAPDEDAPSSPWALTPLEDEAVQARVKGLGTDVANARVAQALGLTPDAASAWLASLAAGQCGWCGGTGEEPALATAAATTASKERECRVCQGRKRCISCSRGHLMRLGDAGAGAALARIRAAQADLRPIVGLEAQRREIARLNEEFLDRHAGTVEAQALIDPPTWMGFERASEARPLVSLSRGRIDLAIEALRAP